ncbi:MAG: hypothetical protein U0176_26435 [Bacteroidia bacterium]
MGRELVASRGKTLEIRSWHFPCRMITMLQIRTLLSTLLLLAFGATVFGQASQFEVGIAGGPSFILLRGNNIIDNVHEPTIGFAAGSSFQWNISRILSLKANPAFERKGSMVFIPLT